MNLSLAHGIGGLAGGLASGLQLGESIKTQRQNRDIQKAEHENVQKQRAQQDERNRLMQEWNAEGAKFLDGRRAEALLAGADEKTWKPSHEDLLGAMDARGAAMFKAGRFDDYTENFAKVEQVRSGMRAKATQDALAAYQVSKDPSALAGVYGMYFPGAQAQSAQRVQGPDGKAVVRFMVRGPDGKQTPQDVDEQELLMGLQGMAMNPAEAAKFAYQRSLENLRLANEVEKIRERLKADKDITDTKHKYRLSEIGAETSGRLRLEDKRGERDDSRLIREERLSLQSRATQLRNRIKDAKDPSVSLMLDEDERAQHQRNVRDMEAELQETNEALRRLESEARGSRGSSQRPTQGSGTKE
jgi:hypothetical protein